jgi:hypothetical protein
LVFAMMLPETAGRLFAVVEAKAREPELPEIADAEKAVLF